MPGTTGYDLVLAYALVTTKPPTPIINAVALLLMTAYLAAWCHNISPFWFNPRFTTDDAFQQAYPFHEVVSPGIFGNDDLISEMILGYLPPLHYWFSYAVTLLTQDPLLTGHWVMACQIALAAFFLFLTLRSLGGIIPAAFGTIWFFHTTSVVNRITLGLARGWAPAILTSFLYFLVQRNIRGMGIVVVLGVLLNPPMALLCITAMGCYCIWTYRSATPPIRSQLVRWLLLTLLLFSLPALYSNNRSPRIGKTVPYSIAEKMPEFHARGRFEFVPMMRVIPELREYGFVAFLHNRAPQAKKLRHIIPPIALGALLLLLITGRSQGRSLFPTPLLFFLIGIIATYTASRVIAFKLFVPDRYLMIPLALLSIVGFTIAAWRLTADTAHPIRKLLPLAGLALFVSIGTGTGLNADMNFNRDLASYGGVWNWVRENTPRNTTIAGDPVHIDPAMLLGQRRAYATMETAFPLFDSYHQEISRRLNIVLRAHYAKSIDEFLEALGDEPVDYFIFRAPAFADNFEHTKRIFHPYTGRAYRLYLKNAPNFAYYELLNSGGTPNSAIVPFHDEKSLVVDLTALKKLRLK